MSPIAHSFKPMCSVHRPKDVLMVSICGRQVVVSVFAMKLVETWMTAIANRTPSLRRRSDSGRPSILSTHLLSFSERGCLPRCCLLHLRLLTKQSHLHLPLGSGRGANSLVQLHLSREENNDEAVSAMWYQVELTF